jgi:hypothetical protein
MSTQQKFESLQAKWRGLDHQVFERRFALKQQYQETWYAPQGKRTSLEALEARRDKACEALYALLDTISPRSWRSTVPCSWVMDRLTFADATTRGQLTDIPQPAYGYMPQDTVRFAWPVREAELQATV